MRALCVNNSPLATVGEICDQELDASISRAPSKSIAGHVSPKMLAHYSHVRMAAKRKALDALACEAPVDSHVTKHDTNMLRVAPAHPQVIERNGRLVG